jgi:hypothetical protein
VSAEQTPAQQAFVAPLQRVPHAPQLRVLVKRLVSHPSSASPLQSPNPVAHASRHLPSRHAGLAFAPVRQTSPHPPQ